MLIIDPICIHWYWYPGTGIGIPSSFLGGFVFIRTDMCVPGTGYLGMHRYLYCTGTRVHEPVGIYRPRYLVFINNVNNKSDLYSLVLIFELIFPPKLFFFQFKSIVSTNFFFHLRGNFWSQYNVGTYVYPGTWVCIGTILYWTWRKLYCNEWKTEEF